MEATLAEQTRPKRNWRFHLISSTGFLCTALLVVAAIYFSEDIQRAWGYGYVGVFLVGILCGVTIIPAPTLLLTFSLGHVLNPLYVGLVAGLGGAIGGITVYMTGAGMENIWSRLWPKMQNSESQQDQHYHNVQAVKSRFWSKGEALYNHLVKWMGGKRGYWTLFISSAMIISPFYFAGLAAGSLRMSFWKFFLLSWAGKTAKYLIVAFAGYWGLGFLLKWIGA